MHSKRRWQSNPAKFAQAASVFRRPFFPASTESALEREVALQPTTHANTAPSHGEAATLIRLRRSHFFTIPRALRPSNILAIILARSWRNIVRFASVAEIKDGLSKYLARAKRRNEPIVVTHHGKPYAVIQPILQGDLEELEWKDLARKKLAKAWEDEDDALYDYL